MRPIDADALVQSICQDQCDYMKETCDADCEMIAYITSAPTVDAVPVVRCKDCKYYCVKDFWADFRGVPILAASDVPTCNKWANTESKVDPDGFCFLAEKKVIE